MTRLRQYPLTANQRKLLLTAARSNGTVTTERFSGHGAHGGKVCGGARESNAATRLSHLGLLEQMTSWSTTNGRIHIYSTTWRLTEAGRNVIADSDLAE